MRLRPASLCGLTATVLLWGVGISRAQSVSPPPEKPGPAATKPQGQDEQLRHARELFIQGANLQKQRDLSGARKCYEGAVAILRKAVPKGHPLIALCLDSLGTVLAE